MSTFFGQLVGFALVVLLLIKFVVPPVRRLMASQQDTIDRQLSESREAAEKVAGADAAHTAAVEQAQEQARRLTEEAHRDAERIGVQMREQAQAEGERIRTQGTSQASLLRTQLIRRLRTDLGAESLRRASELVVEHVSDDDRRSATVDRFLDELDGMAPSATALDAVSVGDDLRSASRDALAATVETFDEQGGDAEGDALSTLADELVSVAHLLDREAAVVKHLADPSDDASPKVALLERLLTGKVADTTLAVLRTAVSQRWSARDDLLTAVEHVARLSLLERAERDGDTDEVADQLFRFGRLLDTKARLGTLLSDTAVPADKRLGLVDSVLGENGGAHPTTVALVRQTVGLLRGRSADDAVRELAELAVARRGEVVAEVTAAAPLTDAQHHRLGDVLGRIYGRPVAPQVRIDTDILGGLVVAVGDEVIDGSLAGRLAAAGHDLPE